MQIDYQHTQPRERIDTVQVAKMLRRALKHDFPGTTFSVRSSRYAGGSSIDVYYTDGPPTKAVERICNAHEGGRFDDMIDLAFHVRHVVYVDANGIERPMLVASDGTEGSRGSDPSYYAHPEDLPPGARPVSLGADYVFAHREYSPWAMRAAVSHYLRRQRLDRYPGGTLEAYEPDWHERGHLVNPPRCNVSCRTANDYARELLRELDLTGCASEAEVNERIADYRAAKAELEARESAEWDARRAAAA